MQHTSPRAERAAKHAADEHNADEARKKTLMYHCMVHVLDRRLVLTEAGGDLLIHES
jgi:hypothetical protein